jgi:hypothetical protein
MMVAARRRHQMTARSHPNDVGSPPTGDVQDQRSLAAEIGMLKRKYEVRGQDDLDDIHFFRTDDRERAEEMRAIMSEDLEDVEMVETTRMIGLIDSRRTVPEATLLVERSHVTHAPMTAWNLPDA